MASIYFQILLLFSVATVVLFWLGYFAFQLLLPKLYDSLAKNSMAVLGLSLSTGFLLSTVLLAVSFTGMKTMMLWPFLLVILCCIGWKNGGVPKLKLIPEGFNLKLKGGFLLALLAVFSYHFWVTSESLFNVATTDVFFYGKVSSGILQEGIESIKTYNNYFAPIKTQTLYHFGDLWLTAVLSKLSGFSEVDVLRLVIYPMMNLSALYLTAGIVMERFKKSNLWSLLIGAGMLYGVALFISLDHKLWSMLASYRGFPEILRSYKLLPIYMLFLMSMLAFYKGQTRTAFLIFSVIPVFYSTVIPALAAGAVGVVLVSYLQRNNQLWNIKWYEPLFIVGAIVFILAYQAFMPMDAVLDSLNGMPYYIYPIKTYIVFTIETFIKIFGEHPVVLLLLVFAMFLGIKNIINRPVTLFSLFGLAGAFVFVYMHAPGIPDLNQAITNTSPVLLLAISLDLMPLMKQKVQKGLIALLLLSGLSNLMFFSFHQRNSLAFAGAEKVFSDEFIQEGRKYVEANVPFVSCTVDTNFMANDINLSYLRWNYDMSPEYNFILMNAQTRPHIEIAPLLENELTAYCKQCEDRMMDFPPCKWFENTDDLTAQKILSALKENKVNHLFLRDDQTVPTDFLSALTFVMRDKKTGASLWKIQ